MEITIGLAFIAGLVSFISPCVLPLVPAYIGYMGGRTVNNFSTHLKLAQDIRNRANTVIHSMFFVAGFSTVFVLIGLLSTAFIQYIGGGNIYLITALIGRVGGVIIIIFGLHFMGVLPYWFDKLRDSKEHLNNVWISLITAILGYGLITWGFSGTLIFGLSGGVQTPLWLLILTTTILFGFMFWLWVGGAFSTPETFWLKTIDGIQLALYSDTRSTLTPHSHQGYWGSAVMGVVFSAGWTPCIGPVYGTVLTMAANGGDIGLASVMLLSYSLGLGIPFVLTAIMLNQMQTFLRRIQRHMRMVEVVSGLFLVIIGLTIASGQLQSLSQQFAGQFADFSIGLEEDVIGLMTGGASEILTPASTNPRQTPEALLIGLEVGNLAPDFTTMTDTGETISLSGMRGQIVLLNFWATWCGPCRVEMPAFQAQFERYAGQDFTIIAVNNSESLSVVREFRDDFGLTFPLALDERGIIQSQFGILSYPSTFIIDEQGVIASRHFGALTIEQIDALFQEHITIQPETLTSP